MRSSTSAPSPSRAHHPAPRWRCATVLPVAVALAIAAALVPGAARAQDTTRAVATPPAAPAPAPASDSALVAALASSRRTLAVAGGSLVGDGARALVDEARRARFVLLGEEHGVAEVPGVAAALFRELASAGFHHLAIETGPAAAAHLDTLARARDPEAAMTAFVSGHYPGVPFYGLREEARLLAEAAAAARRAGARGPVLWGLDYDVMPDRWALGRLRALAPDAAARAAAARAQVRADSMLRVSLATGNPAALFGFAAPEADATALRTAYRPAAGSEADALLDNLAATLRINALMMGGRGYDSNVERARLIKRTLGRRLAEHAGPGGAPPRVMVKFGINHVLRGRNQTGTYDIGAMLPELAEARGERALTVLLIAGAGARAATFDPRTLGYAPQPAPTANEAWARPLFAAADSAGWSLFDLRALRPAHAAGRLGRVAPQLTQLIHGADYAVVLTGSTPSTPLVPSVPPALTAAAGRTGEP